MEQEWGKLAGKAGKSSSWIQIKLLHIRRREKFPINWWQMLQIVTLRNLSGDVNWMSLLGKLFQRSSSDRIKRRRVPFKRFESFARYPFPPSLHGGFLSSLRSKINNKLILILLCGSGNERETFFVFGWLHCADSESILAKIKRKESLFRTTEFNPSHIFSIRKFPLECERSEKGFKANKIKRIWFLTRFNFKSMLLNKSSPNFCFEMPKGSPRAKGRKGIFKFGIYIVDWDRKFSLRIRWVFRLQAEKRVETSRVGLIRRLSKLTFMFQRVVPAFKFK